MEAASRRMASEKVRDGGPQWNLGREYPMAESEKVRTMAKPTNTKPSDALQTDGTFGVHQRVPPHNSRIS
jgi:hypothetical protein